MYSGQTIIFFVLDETYFTNKSFVSALIKRYKCNSLKQNQFRIQITFLTRTRTRDSIRMNTDVGDGETGSHTRKSFIYIKVNKY